MAASDSELIMKVSITVTDNTPASPITVAAPLNSTLYHVMVLGHQQHPGKFSFEAILDPKYGHYITCINNKCQSDPWYWLVYDKKTGELLPKGVDETYPQDGDSYDWKYVDTSTHTSLANIRNFSATELQNAKPAIKNAIVVTLSAVNDQDPSWPAVNNLPAMAEAGSSLGDVMKLAEEQHPLKFRFTTGKDSAHGTYVKSINDLQNETPWNWLVFDPTTSKLLSTGLDDTFPKDKESFLWRYSDKTHPK